MPAGKLIGARVQRVEDPKFIRGKGDYVGGMVLSGMVHLAFIRSRHAHARIRHVDAKRARNLPGVIGVWTGSDTKGVLDPIRPAILQDVVPRFKACEWHPVSFDKARFVGDILGVVAADSRYLAEDAVELVELDLEELEPVADPEKALDAGGPLVHEEWGDNVMEYVEHRAGDVDEAFAQAAVVVRERFHTGRHQALPLETRGCLASYEPAMKTLTVWTSSQVPHLVRTQLAGILHFPDHKMTVIAPDVGGGFGLKCHIFPEEAVTCWVSLKLGRPARWIEDRQEAFLASFHAKDEIVEAELAADHEGKILGVKARIVGDAGAYCPYPFPSSFEPIQVAEMIPGPYQIRNYQYSAYAVATNKPTLAVYRGVGGEVAALTIDHLIHLAACRLGKDPAELFRKNMIRKNQFPYTSASGMYYEPGGYLECLEKALELMGYEKLRKKHQELRKQGVYRGIGISSYTEQTGYGSRFWNSIGVDMSSYESAHFRMDPGGQVTVALGTHSHGQGQHTAFAQVVAEELGVPLEDVTIVLGDTSKTPFGWGTWGSRSTVTGGGALVLGCQRLKERIKSVGAHLMEVSPEDVALEEGVVSVKGVPSKRMTIKEVARAVVYNRAGLLPEGEDAGLELTATYDPPLLTYSNATHVSEVEIDPETGQLHILNYAVVEDCGRMINPMLVDGQIHGGVAQGLGAVLFEEIPYDEHCQPLATSFMDYLVPSACDVPQMIVDHIETPSAMVPGGFKGMGEGGVIAAPACIVNSVSDACGGVPVGRYPLTPERVRDLFQLGFGKEIK
jgi:carbon-monoxide dehydrogenase large subunit